MKIVVTEHVKKRLRDDRQLGITLDDVRNAATKLPGKIVVATRFRGFFASSGRMFDLVVKDIPMGRLIITIIGK